MKIADFLNLRWQLHPASPILQPPRFSPIIADPSLLLPEESADGGFHLFCHSLFGIHHYRSADGLRWGAGRLLFRHAMRPFVFAEGGRYYLFYERYRPFQIAFSWFAAWKWRSHIELRQSSDLIDWSPPQTILSPTLGWHRDRRFGASVSNPCLIKIGDRYRLYYSASLNLIPDCGFCEPAYIGAAEADAITGPYHALAEALISPDRPERNLAAGAIKALPVEDGYVGFENCIGQNEAGQSHSSIYMLQSKDGLAWRFLSDRPLLAPPSGWMRSHIYALDLRFRASERRFYLYFNARDDWHWTKGKERVGLMLGELPAA